MFGADAAAVLRLEKESAELHRPVVERRTPFRAQVLYAARQEMAQTAGDVLARRSGSNSTNGARLEAAPLPAGWAGRKRAVRVQTASQP